MQHVFRTVVLGLMVAAGAGCGAEEEPAGLFEESQGAIEQTVRGGMRAQWPGIQQLDGGRQIRRLNGFNGTTGKEAAYWFMGFSSRRTADFFVFCRHGDEECPLDEHRRFNWEHIVGDPVFSTIPGMEDFSHFWQIWVIRVPDDYEPDTIKSKEGLSGISFDDRFDKAPLMLDFGPTMEAPRVREAIVDCALVLKGTTLEAHGEPMVYKDDDGEEIPTLIVELRTGWFDRYQLHFFDFSQSEGIFPGGRDPQSEREERPLMVTADINVFARPCDIEPRPFICDLIKRETGRAFISERGVETDFMFDNDKGDTNNIISNSPELPPPGEEHHERTTDYSPLWKIWVVELSREHCWEWDLVDTTGSQGESDIRDVRTVFDLEEAGIVTREQMPEDEAGTAIPGNDGVVFFNCPNQVPLGHVPRSEILLREGMFTGRE